MLFITNYYLKGALFRKSKIDTRINHCVFTSMDKTGVVKYFVGRQETAWHVKDQSTKGHVCATPLTTVPRLGQKVSPGKQVWPSPHE